MTRGSNSFFYPCFLLFCLVWFTQCHDTIDVDPAEKDLIHIAYEPVSYTPAIPSDFPALEQPDDNRMTIDGIRLGRKLFYDPILSIDSTVSCSSCHQQFGSFTDQVAISEGVSGFTTRSSMSLINVGMHYHGFFWDGRAATLGEQALMPVEKPIEMGESWDNVEQKLQSHPIYPSEFRKAFGIESTAEINRELAAK